MSFLEEPFEEALRDLPEKKLSWWADFRIKRRLRRKALLMERGSAGVHHFFLRPILATGLAFAFLLTTTTTYAYQSSSVVRGDFLYPVKQQLETAFYPESGSSSEQIDYHLQLSDRRYSEASEIVRRSPEEVGMILKANAEDPIGISTSEQILSDTIQDALDQVDLALLISTEIDNQDQLVAVKQKIQKKVTSQQTYFQTLRPHLKRVQLRRQGREQAFPEMMERKIADQLAAVKEIEQAVEVAHQEKLASIDVLPVHRLIVFEPRADFRFAESYKKHLEVAQKRLEKQVADRHAEKRQRPARAKRPPNAAVQVQRLALPPTVLTPPEQLDTCLEMAKQQCEGQKKSCQKKALKDCQKNKLRVEEDEVQDEEIIFERDLQFRQQALDQVHLQLRQIHLSISGGR